MIRINHKASRSKRLAINSAISTRFRKFQPRNSSSLNRSFTRPKFPPKGRNNKKALFPIRHIKPNERFAPGAQIGVKNLNTLPSANERIAPGAQMKKVTLPQPTTKKEPMKFDLSKVKSGLLDSGKKFLNQGADAVEDRIKQLAQNVSAEFKPTIQTENQVAIDDKTKMFIAAGIIALIFFLKK